MPSRILVATWREEGPGACVRKLRAATGMALPMMLTGRRTAGGVAAYFDLITERRSEIVHRYRRRIADRTRAQLHRIPTILACYGSFPVLSVLK
jgi:hypothetical protein